MFHDCRKRVVSQIEVDGGFAPSPGLDSERDHRACGEEGMKFIGWTIEFQNTPVGEPEPHEIIGLPGDRNTHDIPKQSNSFVQPITSDSDESHLQHRH
jgi:hypothetical protein